MLKLTKFTGDPFWLNPDAVIAVEECGDTVITLSSGDRVLVKEGALEIQQRFITYKRQIHAGAPLMVEPALATSHN